MNLSKMEETVDNLSNNGTGASNSNPTLVLASPPPLPPPAMSGSSLLVTPAEAAGATKMKVHKEGCLIRNWESHKDQLCKDQEIHEALMNHFMKKKSWNNQKAVDEAQRKCAEALAKDGHIVWYLKAQREMFAEIQQRDLQGYQCKCDEENISTN